MLQRTTARNTHNSLKLPLTGPQHQSIQTRRQPATIGPLQHDH